MRKVLLLLAILSVPACTATADWQKPNTDLAALNLDLGKCRHHAQQEAMRLYAGERTYPFYGQPFFYGGWPSMSWWLKRTVEKDQASAQQMLADTCMKKKGYEPIPA